MSNISCYFPAGTHSLTRQWMERQPSQKELLVTLLAVGVLSSVASYYNESAYLITGSSCWAISYGLLKEPKNERRSESPGLSVISPISNDPFPLRIMRFIALSAFLGRCIRKSWIPSDTPNPNWTPYLLKAPFHFVSFSMALQSARGEISNEIGKKTASFICKKPNEREVFISAVAILVMSSTVTFIAPRLNLLLGVVAIETTFQIGLNIELKESDIKDMLKLGSTSIKLAMLFALGGWIGHLTRSLIGPSNRSPAYSWPAKIYFMITLIPYHILAFFLLILTHITKDKESEVLEWIDKTFPQLDQYASLFMKFPEALVNNLQEYSTLSLREIEDIISNWDNVHRSKVEEFNRLHNLYNKGALPQEQSQTYSDLDFEVTLLNYTKKALVIMVELSESKNENIQSSIKKLTIIFEDLKEFYEKVTRKTVPSYEAEALKNKEINDLNSLKTDFKDRVNTVTLSGKESIAWTKAQAAYVLLAGYDKNDPNNAENMQMQKENYKKLALLFHPDKHHKQEDQYQELFQSLQKAKETLNI